MLTLTPKLAEDERDRLIGWQLGVRLKRTRGSRPAAKPSACPVLPRSGTGEASPAATPPPLAPLGLERPQTAID